MFGKRSTSGRRPDRSVRQAKQQSAKQGVFSYYSNQPPQQGRAKAVSRPATPKQQGRGRLRDRNWVRNLPSLIALVAVSLCVLYCLGLTTNPVVVVSASSPQAVSLRNKTTYQAGAQKILEGSILNRTKFTINSAGFEKAFKEEFPEVGDVSLALPIISRRPVVTISTAQPQLLLVSHGNIYVLDKRGTVIMNANELSSSIRQSLPVVTDQSGLSASVGKTVLPSDNIEFITTVVAQLKAKGITPETITLPAAAHEVDLKPTAQPYFIKFSTDTEAREAAGAFLATKAKLEQMNSVPKQYIDVRVVGRAYFQ